jgi:hypothetical protein
LGKLAPVSLLDVKDRSVAFWFSHGGQEGLVDRAGATGSVERVHGRRGEPRSQRALGCHCEPRCLWPPEGHRVSTPMIVRHNRSPAATSITQSGIPMNSA